MIFFQMRYVGDFEGCFLRCLDRGIIWQNPRFLKSDNVFPFFQEYSNLLQLDDNYSNYQSLIRERKVELIRSMNTETKTFPKELLQ